MDDPIFDPWPIEEASPGADAESSRPETATPTGTPTPPTPTPPTPGPPTPGPPPSRWRSTTTRDVPARRPAPAAEPREESAEVDTNPRTSPKTGRQRQGLPLRPPSPPVREPGAPAAARPPASSALVEHLRDIALPRLEALATRLEVARHRTLLDDRLDRAEQVLRFRLMPWQAPFDVAGVVPGSVLELAVEGVSSKRAGGSGGGGKGARVAARFWLDPLATTPAEETLIDARRLTDAWLEAVLLDFVGRVLGRL